MGMDPQDGSCRSELGRIRRQDREAAPPFGLQAGGDEPTSGEMAGGPRTPSLSFDIQGWVAAQGGK